MAYTIDANGNLVPISGDVPRNVIEKTFTLSRDLGGAKAGDVITMAVTPVDTAQVTELENYLGGYQQFGLAQDIVSPIVPVDKETGKRRDFSYLNVFAPVEDRVGRSGAINQIEHASATREYKVEEHALAAFVPFASERDAVANYNVRTAHLDEIRDKLSLNREIRTLDKATATTTWNANNYHAITTNYRWNTGTTKSILQDLRDRCKASWAPVTDILMTQEVAGYLTADSTVKAVIELGLGTAGPKGGVLADLGDRGLQRLKIPTLPPITIVESRKYTSGAMSTVLADDVLLIVNPPTLSGGNTLASFVSLRYRGRSGTGYTVNEYVPYGRGLNGGTMIEAGYADADEVPGTGADSSTSRIGGLIKSVLTGS